MAGFFDRIRGLLPEIDNVLAVSRQLERLSAPFADAALAADLTKIHEACRALYDMAHSPEGHLLAPDAPDLELRRQARHELRTPINVIKGYSEMLLEDANDGIGVELASGLRELVGRAERLLLSIDELFREPVPALTGVPANGDGNVEAAAARDSHAMGGHILAVDDTPENLDVLARRLERLGHRVTTTTSGLHALEALGGDKFDLVLLDLMMPEIDGFEVLQRIKSAPATLNLPVIMISALNETASVVRCLDAGADDYLSKPFDPTLLRARVGASLERKRLRDVEQANSERLEMQAEILARELDAARRMQQSILPTRYPLCPTGANCRRCGQEQCERFSSCPGIRLCASMIPAKVVGGDFYDFFWLDNQHLGFAVADVSGKGVPAALFMSLSLALLRTIAPSSSGPADCLTRINRQLCVDNEMSMFVTMFYGIYDATSGFLRYANAGHGLPLITGPDRKTGTLPRVGGVALGITDEIAFGENSVEIPHGSTLCVYTDGVTEAIDLNGQEFGDARLVEVLQATVGVSVDGILAKVLGAVNAFAQGTPQADDITCLILRRANSRRRDTLKLVLTNQLPEILRVSEAIEGFLCQHEHARAHCHAFNLVLDEMLTNIISYGFPGGGRSEIELDLFLDDNKIVARILDCGTAFNPLSRAAPDLTSSVDDRTPGGLGVHFAKTLMDEVDYWRQNDKNCLLLVKRI